MKSKQKQFYWHYWKVNFLFLQYLCPWYFSIQILNKLWAQSELSCSLRFAFCLASPNYAVISLTLLLVFFTSYINICCLYTLHFSQTLDRYPKLKVRKILITSSMFSTDTVWTLLLNFQQEDLYELCNLVSTNHNQIFDTAWWLVRKLGNKIRWFPAAPHTDSLWYLLRL